VVSFVESGLRDLSISRTSFRWGIPVPDDPEHVIYVWFDALSNYITALGYGQEDALFQEVWPAQLHLVGKDILRFHAVYWPAMLLSAQEPLPSTVAVHDYLTVDGGKISKSLGNVIDPKALVDRFGRDALRWWLLRDVPTLGEADFSLARLVERANQDLANGLGNLANRTFSMIHRYRDGAVPEAEWPAQAEALRGALDGVAAAIDEALARFDFRAATGELWRVVDEANRLVDATKPWDLSKAERDGAAPAALDGVLAALFAAVRGAAEELEPFLPDLAAKVGEALGDGSRVPKPEPLFPRLELEP
jgi:methionyl-tRNA synthetase